MVRFALVVVVGWLTAGPAFADLPKIDHTIGKEPAYRTNTPRYGLLVFGPEGKDRVWLVHDGDCLYVDRNGNGDLTDPGEKVTATKLPGWDPEKFGYSFNVGQVTVGGRTHKGLQVDCQRLGEGIAVDAEVPGLKGGGLGSRVSYLAGGRDLNGVLQFADTPAKAPIVHIGGPLQVTFYAERPTLRIGRENELVLVVGTSGIGPGTFVMVRYQDTIPDSARPVAEITYPPLKPGLPPVRQKYEIKDRC